MKDREDSIKKEHERIKAKFLEILALENVAGNITIACKMMGRARSFIYVLRKEDREFALKWDKVVDEAQERLADYAESQLFQLVKEKNPAAIFFTLKNLRPDKWRERHEHSGLNGQPIQHSHAPSPEFAIALRQLMSKVNGKT